jgi:hypothetical protein
VLAVNIITTKKADNKKRFSLIFSIFNGYPPAKIVKNSIPTKKSGIIYTFSRFSLPLQLKNERFGASMR